MPTRDEMIAAGKRAVAAGDNEAANEIAEALAQMDGLPPSAPARPAQPAGPNLDTRLEQQGGVDKFLTGLDRLPNLVGMGRFGVLGDQRTGNKDMGTAVNDVVSGAGKSLYATARSATDVLGPVDDAVIAGVSEVGDAITGKDTGSFQQKFDRAQQLADELRDDEGFASLVGDVAGFGYTGKALKSVAATRGVKIGIAGEAGIITGLNSLADGNTPQEALTDAATAAVFGKVFEVGLNRVAKPVAEWAAPRVERVWNKARGRTGRAVEGGGTKPGEPRVFRDVDQAEFDIPEGDIQRIANRLKMPAEQVRAEMNRYIAANGPDVNILSLVNRETANEFETLARTKKDAGDVFREAEEAALLARPDKVAASVRRTGDSATASEVTDDMVARGTAAQQRTTAQLDDLTASTKAGTTAAQRAIADQAAINQRGIAEQATNTRRMIRDETGSLIAKERAAIDASSAKLAETIKRNAQGIDTDEKMLGDLDKHTSLVFRGGVTETGEVVKGLASKRITLPARWLNKNFPENPTQIAAVLRAKADTLPKGAQRNRLLKAIDAMVGEVDDDSTSKWAKLALTLDDVDTLRRVLKKPVDVAGVKYNLTKVGNALRDFAAKKHPAYQTDYLDAFANTSRELEARGLGKAATSGKGADAAADVELRMAKAKDVAAQDAIAAGARDGALREIAQSTKDGAQVLRTAAAIIRNADAIIRLAGKDGEELVKVVRSTMNNVGKIREEIADIKAAARTTREGVADEARTSMARVADEAKAAQRELTDAQTKRLGELNRAAKAQLDRIKMAMAKNERAIDAAAKVLSMTESEFAAATAGSREPLGAVARESIAGQAAQSPEAAIKVSEQLATPSTARRVERVTGKQTADTLADIGRTQRREIENYNIAAARTKEARPVSEELSGALAAAAAATGRVGPLGQASMIKQVITAVKHLAIPNRAAKAMAQAVIKQDADYVERVINRIAKTEKQRKAIAQALNAWATGLAAGQFTEWRE